MEFLQFSAEYFDLPYTPVRRTARDIENEECEAYLAFLDGQIIHGKDAIAHGWLPFVAHDPVIDESFSENIQDVGDM